MLDALQTSMPKAQRLEPDDFPQGEDIRSQVIASVPQAWKERVFSIKDALRYEPQSYGQEEKLDDALLEKMKQPVGAGARNYTGILIDRLRVAAAQQVRNVVGMNETWQEITGARVDALRDPPAPNTVVEWVDTVKELEKKWNEYEEYHRATRQSLLDEGFIRAAAGG